MREAGVEPARLAALEPKSSASASFATLAEPIVCQSTVDPRAAVSSACRPMPA